MRGAEAVRGACLEAPRGWRSRLIEGRRLLLIDDVLTTGATAEACALALEGRRARRSVDASRSSARVKELTRVARHMSENPSGQTARFKPDAPHAAQSTIYTRPFCGFCARALAAPGATRASMSFTEIEAGFRSGRQEARDGRQRSTAARPFRRSSSASVHVGGCDELMALDRRLAEFDRHAGGHDPDARRTGAARAPRPPQAEAPWPIPPRWCARRRRRARGW